MFMHTLDHVQAEPKLEVQEEHVQKEHGGPQATSCVDTNIAVEQSKPRCIPPIFLGFSFLITIIMLCFIVH
jgi:hypothetical protein